MNTTEQQRSICFHTNTEFDPLAFKMMGVHAKECSNPIGRFGTGLKYAIAILLRTGHQITIHSKGNDYRFWLGTVNFRGKEFDVVICNDEQLPFTTEYGKDWETWNAYRELVSNTMDEGGIHFPSDSPMEDGTSIIVTGNEFAECFDNHEDYFVGSRTPLFTDQRLSIYEGNGTIYFKGVRVGSFEKGRFSYEILDQLALTEDRSCNIYSAKFKVEQGITSCNNKSFIRQFLTGPHTDFERSLDYDWNWSPEFLEVASEIYERNPTMLPKGVFKQLKKHRPDAGFQVIESEQYTATIKKAVDFLRRAGYHVTEQIVVVENEDDALIAFYTNERIHLTTRAFEKGMYYLVNTLFEEHCHTLGYHDETRSFQNYLIEQLIIQAQKNLREIL